MVGSAHATLSTFEKPLQFVPSDVKGSKEGESSRAAYQKQLSVELNRRVGRPFPESMSVKEMLCHVLYIPYSPFVIARRRG